MQLADTKYTIEKPTAKDFCAVREAFHKSTSRKKKKKDINQDVCV